MNITYNDMINHKIIVESFEMKVDNLNKNEMSNIHIIFTLVSCCGIV